jgi:hypothetical protein
MPIDAQDREAVAELQRMLRELFDLALIGSAVHEPRLPHRSSSAASAGTHVSSTSKARP